MSQEHKSMEPIYVTRSFLPPRAEYDAWLDKVYASNVLTNNGPSPPRVGGNTAGSGSRCLTCAS
jgi:uncharacterized protein YciI